MLLLLNKQWLTSVRNYVPSGHAGVINPSDPRTSHNAVYKSSVFGVRDICHRRRVEKFLPRTMLL